MDFIVVQDTWINHFNRGKRENEESSIVYSDKRGKMHEINLDSCALNYSRENTNSSGKCVGERNIDEMYVLFYTSGVKTKIVFKKRFVGGFFREYLLMGSRETRFQDLTNFLESLSYSTLDLS